MHIKGDKSTKTYIIYSSIFIPKITVSIVNEFIFHLNLHIYIETVVWLLHLQLPVQSVSITPKVVSSNPVHDKVYSIQHYVIKFISDLRQVGGFLQVPRLLPPIKLIATI